MSNNDNVKLKLKQEKYTIDKLDDDGNLFERVEYVTDYHWFGMIKKQSARVLYRVPGQPQESYADLPYAGV